MTLRGKSFVIFTSSIGFALHATAGVGARRKGRGGGEALVNPFDTLVSTRWKPIDVGICRWNIREEKEMKLETKIAVDLRCFEAFFSSLFFIKKDGAEERLEVFVVIVAINRPHR